MKRDLNWTPTGYATHLPSGDKNWLYQKQYIFILEQRGVVCGRNDLRFAYFFLPIAYLYTLTLKSFILLSGLTKNGKMPFSLNIFGSIWDNFCEKTCAHFSVQWDKFCPFFASKGGGGTNFMNCLIETKY